METGDQEAEPQFSQPVRQITSMLVVSALVCAGAYLAFPRVGPVFLANPYLNGFIFLVFVIGVLSCFGQVWQLIKSVGWIEGFAGEKLGSEIVKAPGLLAPLATLLRSRNPLSSARRKSLITPKLLPQAHLLILVRPLVQKSLLESAWNRCLMLSARLKWPRCLTLRFRK